MRHKDGTQFPHVSENGNWLFPTNNDLKKITRRIKRFKDILEEVKNIIFVYSSNHHNAKVNVDISPLKEIFNFIKNKRDDIKYNTYILTIDIQCEKISENHFLCNKNYHEKLSINKNHILSDLINGEKVVDNTEGPKGTQHKYYLVIS